MQDVKKWYQSKTVWLSIAQGVAGIIVAILAQDPAIKGAGVLAVIKSILDFFVRLNTTATITQ